MKRPLSIAVASVLLLAPAAETQLAIGAKGGLIISNMSVTENGAEPEIPYDSRTGLLLGATLGVGVTPWLTLQVEGRYAQKGTKQTDDGLTAALRLTYLDLPLTARVSIPTGASPIRPYVYAGGFVGFETGCGLTTSGTVQLELDCETADVNRQTSDYGLVIGGGTDVRLGPGAVTLDVEYVIGLRNLAEDQTAGEAFGRLFAFAAGYKLFL